MVHTIPARFRWAVDVMDIQPSDQVLEIGCGAGQAAGLVASRLDKGKILAIDRAEAAVDRTKRRNAAYVESGRLTVRHIDLATLRVPIKRLDKAFAIDVNLFWVRECQDEVELLHERLSPGGTLHLFYEVTRHDELPMIVEKSSQALVKAGFRVTAVQSQRPAMIGIVGRR
jgi:cyclopropane fatty-acyl-phospholipid synthase-like methyltransferase